MIGGSKLGLILHVGPLLKMLGLVVHMGDHNLVVSCRLETIDKESMEVSFLK